MKNLRTARNEAGYTQKALATLLNISQQCYSDYENERTEPDLTTLSKIAETLNTSVDYLLGRTDELGTIVPKPSTVSALSEGEETLLRYFRILTPELQAIALDAVRVLAGAPAGNGLQKKA